MSPSTPDERAQDQPTVDESVSVPPKIDSSPTKDEEQTANQGGELQETIIEQHKQEKEGTEPDDNGGEFTVEANFSESEQKETTPAQLAEDSDFELGSQQMSSDGGSADARLYANEAERAFFKNVVQSGLLTEKNLEEALSARGNSQTGEFQNLAEWLVSEEKLTAYQANAIAQGKTKGLLLGKYEILDKIGQGGMGMVFKARHRRMKRLVALKVLPPNLVKSEAAIARFHREIEAASKLTHPNIAAALDADEAQATHFFVMEYVAGLDLGSLVKQKGKVPLPVALHLILQTARGLAHAHNLGIIHRDIKPANLLLDTSGTVKVLDMGLARITSTEEQMTELTHSGNVMGTVDYMAPEQALDAKHVDHRADIYSLGGTLYYLLHGKPMVPEGTMTQKLMWHQTGEIPSLQDFSKNETETKAEALFHNLVAKKIEDRPESMLKVIEAIEILLEGYSEEEFQISTDSLEVNLVTAAPATHQFTGAKPTLAESNPVIPTALKKRATGTPMPRLLLFGGIPAAILLMFGALWGGGFFSSSGDPGLLTLTVTGLPDGASFSIDGQIQTGKQHGQNRLYKVTPGEHEFVGSADGYKTLTRTLTLTTSQGVEFHLLENHKESDQSKRGNGSGVLVGNNNQSDSRQKVSIPAEKLLNWVFDNGGSVKLLQEDSQERIFYKLENIPPNYSNILEVNLSKTSVQDSELEHLLEHADLQSLNLANTKISDIGLKTVARLSDLWTLNLSETPITNEGLATLARLSNLRDLYLQKTAITDQGLAQIRSLEKLEKLYLSDTKIGDIGMAHLRNLKNLQHLAINGTYVSDDAFTKTKEGLDNLEIVWDGYDTERKIARELLTKKTVLQLQTRDKTIFPLVETPLQFPRDRFTIIEVKATGSLFDVADLKKLTTLTNLRKLEIANTKITAMDLPHLHELTTLKTVDIGTLLVPETQLKAFATALPDCQLVRSERADRKVAESLLAKGAKLKIISDGHNLEITDKGDLPPGNFALVSIDFFGKKEVNNDDLKMIVKLTELESLFLGSTSIDDEGVATLLDLSRLRDLGISSTKVTTSGVELLEKLPTLRRLYLDEIPLTESALQTVASLPELTHLSLQGAGLKDQSLERFKASSHLQWLGLSKNQLTDKALPHFSKLAHISEIHIGQTNMTDYGIEELLRTLPESTVVGYQLDPQRLAAQWLLSQGGRVGIESLGSQSAILETPSDLPKTACKILSIELTELASFDEEKLIEHLENCPDLKRVNFQNSAVTKSSVETLLTNSHNLTDLNLSETSLSDDGFDAIGDLTKLETLDLRQTNVRGKFLASVSLKENNMHSLFLGYSLVNDRSVVSLTNLEKLQTLDLEGTLISDQGINTLAKMQNLRRLSLKGTQISDEGLKNLSAINQLEILNLSQTALTTLTGLDRLVDLIELDVSRTKITDKETVTLTKMTSLKKLNIFRTQMTQEGISRLKGKLSETKIIESATEAQKRDSRDALQGDGGSVGIIGDIWTSHKE